MCIDVVVIFSALRVGPGVYLCRTDPLRYLAGWRERRLNQAFSFVLV